MIKRILNKFDSFAEKNLGEHIDIFGKITVFGNNAMHYTTRVRMFGFYICFRLLPVWSKRRWWPAYIYISKDGTPQTSVFCIPKWRRYYEIKPKMSKDLLNSHLEDIKNGEKYNSGDIWLCLGRLVLIIAIIEDHANICLLTNEVDMVTDFDALLRREDTGLPFDLLAEMDLTAIIRISMLEKCLGNINLELVYNCRPMNTGTKVNDRNDPRWSWKESELADYHRITKENASQ